MGEVYRTRDAKLDRDVVPDAVFKRLQRLQYLSVNSPFEIMAASWSW